MSPLVIIGIAILIVIIAFVIANLDRMGRKRRDFSEDSTYEFRNKVLQQFPEEDRRWN